jgi:hypothetical protein
VGCSVRVGGAGGDALAPHHFYVGVALSLFGFTSIWPYYPATGAGFAFIGLLVALDDVTSVEITPRSLSVPLVL